MKRSVSFMLISLLLSGLFAAEPTQTRPQQDRLQRLLEQADTNVPAALAAAAAIPAADRDARLWRWMADMHAAEENWTAALEHYAGAVEAFPTYRDALLNFAQTAVAADQPAAALPALQRGLREGLSDPRIYLALGLIAEQTDDLILAESAYRSAWLMDTQTTAAREGIARILIGQQRYGEAETLLLRLLQESPARASFWRLYADLAQARGQTLLAAQRLESASRLGATDDQDLARLLELYTVLDRPLDVLRLHAAAPAVLRDAPSLGLRVISGLLSLGHEAAARELLAAVPSTLRSRSDRLLLIRIQAQLALLANEAEAAAVQLQRGLEEDPLDAMLLRLAGEAWLQADRPREAIPFFERLSRQPGQEAQGLWLQGIAEARSGQIPQAVRLLEAAMQIEELPGLRRSLDQLRRMAP